ncbi:MAG: YraN family protein [Acidobacteriia bacterium]|nr:YraN family protein [Terriglobia bacterium]
MSTAWQRLLKSLTEYWSSVRAGFFRVDSPFPTDPHSPLALGRRGERAAFIFLQHQGYMIVARNFRTNHGEIDLVAWDRGILCFVEVKTRTTTEHGRPEEAVTTFKQRQILNTSLDYLRQANLHSVDIRFDIVSVQFNPDGSPLCELTARAFGPRMN